MKRLLCAVLAIMMIVITLPINVIAKTEYPFYDISENAWYRDAVEYCYVNDLIKGISETEFSPSMELTRAMFVTMLARLAKADTSEYTGSSFSDVKTGSWYAPSVEWAYSNGITGGTGNALFSPDAAITREQLCRFFHNYIKTTEAELNTDNTILDKYTDKDQISDWAAEDVAFAASNGIINSTSADTYKIEPKTIVTRAQAAQFFMNFKTVFASAYPLDSKIELDNRCRAAAEIGEEKLLTLIWEGENTELTVSNGERVTLEKGRKYNITYTRTDNLNVTYASAEEVVWSLSLNANGGVLTYDAVYTLREGQSYASVFGEELPVPTLKGYSFMGWYCEEKDYLLDINDSFIFEDNVTFNACWEANEYTLSFGTDSFTAIINNSYSEILAELSEPEKAGYSFKGWYCEEIDYTLDLNDNFEYAQDLSFEALWTPNTYTISFDAKGAEISGITEYEIKYDHKISDVIDELPSVSLKGNEFYGWYDTKNDYLLDISDTYTFADNITLSPIWQPKEYTISFDANGGELAGDNKFTAIIYDEYSTVLSELSDPQREGYSFKGWLCGTYLLNLNDKFEYAENITFIAIWSPNSYTLTFENGEVYTLKYDQRIGDVISQMPSMSRTGYTFKKWYCEAKDYTLDLRSIYSFTEDIYFNAVWAPNRYTVTFDSAGGVLEGERDYYIDYDQAWIDVIPKEPKVSRNGYTFKYWYCEKYDYRLDLSPFSVYSVNEDMTFIAVWSPNSYTLTFENGEEYTVKFDQKIIDVLSEYPSISKTGYTFESWYCESKDYTLCLNDIYNFTESISFKAIFTPNTYTVSFENGQKYTIKYDQSFEEVISELPTVAKTGYTFVSWYCKATDYTLELTDIYNFTNDINFKAIWSANTYTLSFENGEEYTVKYDQPISDILSENPSMNKTGYTLKEWYCEANDYTLDLTDIYSFANDSCFKAIWKPNKYTITFDADIGILEGENEYYIDYDQPWAEVIAQEPQADCEGYSFEYWYCEKYDYRLDLSPSAIYTLNEDITFIAVWSPNSYTLTFEGGNAYTVNYDQNISDVIAEIPAIEKTGYTFDSWYCESEDYTLNTSDTYNFTHDIVFKAIWTVNTYNITFENGEVYAVNFDQRLGDVIIDTPVLERSGYTFKEWYCEAKDKVLNLTDIYNYTEDIHFKAVWMPNTYSITFENGETYTVNYDQNISDVIAEIPAIEKTGYTFDSWYCESEDYTLDTFDTYSFTHDIVFKAIWTVNTYNITFENGEVYAVNFDQRLGDVIIDTPVLERSGYTFKEWYCEAKDYTLELNDTYSFTEDITMVGIFEPIEYTLSFDPNGGTMLSESSYTIKYGQTISDVIPSDPTAYNAFYELQYWYCEDSDYTFNISDQYLIADNVIFTAVWKDEDPYSTAMIKIAEYQAEMTEKYPPEQRGEEIIDIILFAGQSNSSGRATDDEISEKEDIFMTVDTSKAFTFYNTKFSVPMEIEEPIIGNGTDDKYYGYIPAFLNSYYDSTGRRVCACFKSVGGMMLNTFLPYEINKDGEKVDNPQKFYTDMVSAINHAKLCLENADYTVGNIYMVWCQGEADATYYGFENNYANVIEQELTDYDDKIDYYKDTFTDLFESLQKDTGLEKVFMVRVGHSNKSGEDLRNRFVIDAQTELCHENDDMILVSTLFAGAKTYRASDGTTVNLMRDASHYWLEAYIMVGTEAGKNVAIYLNSDEEIKPMLLEYHTQYLESLGIYDDTIYDHEYKRYIYDPDD